FMKTPHSREVLNNINKVNKDVRFIFKPGLPVYTLFDVYKDKLVHNRGANGKLEKKLYPEDAYLREHKRLFGKSKFDYVIDFSGYSLYCAKYLVCADAKKKICYMHNDLLSDSERLVNGRRPHKINLRGLFSIYNKFDKLVSVSKGTMELNKKNLAIYADEDKFDYIMNSINPEKILGIDHLKEKDTEKLAIAEQNHEEII
ncbi:glycosyltransferase, partial [Bacillus paralicheniformis]|nr:glycosyltransferase [Bacillus paralicheniformis]